MKGGNLNFLGSTYKILGLVRAHSLLQAITAELPPSSPVRPRVEQVESFAEVAVQHLGGSKAVIGAVAEPIGVKQEVLSGHRTPLNDYAVAVAVSVSLMFVCILLASGMLALEREEGTLARLRRGLVPAGLLLGAKALLAAIVGFAVSFAMLAGIGIFVPLDWARVGLWIASIAVGSVAFATLGVAMGAIVRDLRAASLLALFVSLPLVFLALVPSAAVSSALFDAIRIISAIFPFKPALEALDAAINQSQPSLLEALGHLAALIAGFGVVARLALRG